MIEMPEEDIEPAVDRFLNIARNQLNTLEENIKKCNMSGIIDSYAFISVNLQNASSLAPDLSTRAKKMEEILDIHDKKHKLIDNICNICECKPKEPFRYVKEPPKE